jgi:hypothetical protein
MEIRISAWNGFFGGTAELYVGIEQMNDVATKLRGFPVNLSDVREVTIGGFGPEWAGGAASMRFYCIDGKGHACIEAKIESDYNSSGKAQSVVMTLFIEPAALDRFVQGLDKLEPEKGGQVFLEGS